MVARLFSEKTIRVTIPRNQADRNKQKYHNQPDRNKRKYKFLILSPLSQYKGKS